MMFETCTRELVPHDISSAPTPGSALSSHQHLDDTFFDVKCPKIEIDVDELTGDGDFVILEPPKCQPGQPDQYSSSSSHHTHSSSTEGGGGGSMAASSHSGGGQGSDGDFPDFVYLQTAASQFVSHASSMQPAQCSSNSTSSHQISSSKKSQQSSSSSHKFVKQEGRQQTSGYENSSSSSSSSNPQGHVRLPSVSNFGHKLELVGANNNNNNSSSQFSSSTAGQTYFLTVQPQDQQGASNTATLISTDQGGGGGGASGNVQTILYIQQPCSQQSGGAIWTQLGGSQQLTAIPIQITTNNQIQLGSGAGGSQIIAIKQETSAQNVSSSPQMDSQVSQTFGINVLHTGQQRDSPSQQQPQVFEQQQQQKFVQQHSQQQDNCDQKLPPIQLSSRPQAAQKMRNELCRPRDTKPKTVAAAAEPAKCKEMTKEEVISTYEAVVMQVQQQAQQLIQARKLEQQKQQNSCPQQQSNSIQQHTSVQQHISTQQNSIQRNSIQQQNSSLQHQNSIQQQNSIQHQQNSLQQQQSQNVLVQENQQYQLVTHQQLEQQQNQQLLVIQSSDGQQQIMTQEQQYGQQLLMEGQAVKQEVPSPLKRGQLLGSTLVTHAGRARESPAGGQQSLQITTIPPPRKMQSSRSAAKKKPTARAPKGNVSPIAPRNSLPGAQLILLPEATNDTSDSPVYFTSTPSKTSDSAPLTTINNNSINDTINAILSSNQQLQQKQQLQLSAAAVTPPSTIDGSCLEPSISPPIVLSDPQDPGSIVFKRAADGLCICPVCGKTFPGHSKAVRHYQSVHTKLRYPCPLCSASLTEKGHLKRHIKDKHKLPEDAAKAMADSTVAV